MTDDDLWLPAPTVMDADPAYGARLLAAGGELAGRLPGERDPRRGGDPDHGNAYDGHERKRTAGHAELYGHAAPHADAERPRAGKGAGYRNLRDDIDCLPTPTSNEWNGGTMVPERRAAMGHTVTVADWAEKSDDIDILPEARLFATPNCMDAIAPRDGAALERVLRREPTRFDREPEGGRDDG